MTKRKIIIVDDNTQNGQFLYEACRIEAPEWEFLWLQVTSLEPPDYLPNDFTENNYKIVGSLEEASEAINEVASAAMSDLIVFYDLQLKELQTDTEAATDSPITEVLKRLMTAEGTRMVVSVHSASLSSAVVGKSIDPTLARVISNHYVTQQTTLSVIRDYVKETVQLWESLYTEKSVSLKEFVDAMQKMYHDQIQNFDGFIGKIEEEKRGGFQDPKQLLTQFLGMGKSEFENHFCDGAKHLKPKVIEALKSISGVVDSQTGRNESRPMTWAGGWFLALGQFRALPFGKIWASIFAPEDLEKLDYWPFVHAYQKVEKRTATLELFGEMCSVLFLKKGTQDQCALEKVTLDDERFSFLLDFPCVSAGEDQTESLLGRILSEAAHAIDMTYKKEDHPMVKEGHDTSRAIWRVFLSSHVSDLSDLISDMDYGLFGRFTRMNIVSVNGEKTEVIWRK
jgi:hypothetical protein